MEPLFSTSAKTHDQVLDEYHRAASPTAWLLNEIRDFFNLTQTYSIEEERDPELLVRSAQDLLSDDEAQFLEFTAGVCDSHDLLYCEVLISGEHDKNLVFRSVPTPMSLLWLCCQICRPGDEVTLVHHDATNQATSISSHWPFSMDDAVTMTTTNPADLVADSVETTTRRSRRPGELSLHNGTLALLSATVGSLLTLGALRYYASRAHQH